MDICSDPDRTCRACVNPLSDGKYDLISTPNLSELYVRLSTLQLSSDDPLPKMLCTKCYNLIREFDAFQKMCIESYNFLYSKFLEKCLKLESMNELVKEEKISVGDYPLEIQPYIGFEGGNDNISKKDINITSLNNEECSSEQKLKESKEGIPDFSVDDSDDEILAEKVKKSERIKIENINENKVNSMAVEVSPYNIAANRNETESPDADTTLQNPKRRRKTRKEKKSSSDDDPSVSGKESSETNIKADKDLSKTGELEHHRTSPFVCGKCSKKFYTKVHYEGHMRKHQGEKPYVCEHCPRGYSRLVRLKDHILSDHSGEKVWYYCTVEGCERKYRCQQSLDRHLKGHFNPQPETKTKKATVICEQCGKILSKGVLREHEMMHKGIFPHVCDQCPKKFRFRNKLEEHKLVHLGIKKHSCSVCGMKKTTKKELAAHMNVHTREKEYPCQFCKSCFLTNANLVRHILVVHDGIKNFHCTYCGESFGKSETLKHHMMRHTGEKPHKCPYCERRFIQKAAMIIHARRHEAKGDKLIDAPSEPS